MGHGAAVKTDRCARCGETFTADHRAWIYCDPCRGEICHLCQAPATAYTGTSPRCAPCRADDLAAIGRSLAPLLAPGTA